MEIEKLIERLKECSTYGFKQEICGDAATALSTLQAENAQLRADLEYEREHANAYYEECGQWEAENEKLRAELEQVKRERDPAILFAQCYTEKVENPCTVCRHRFSEAGVPLKKRCENCGLTGTPECGWEFDFDWDLKSEED